MRTFASGDASGARRSAPRGRRRFLRDLRGASAVEFAIVAPVFFMFMFSTFEVAWFYFVNASVDGASIHAARLLRTGQVQKAELDKDEFYYDVVCPKLAVFGDCSSRLTVEVKTYTSFSELASDTSPIVCQDEEQTTIDAIPYEPGEDESIIRLRLCYMYDTINPAIGLKLAQDDSGRRKVMASYVLRVEPYTKESPES